MVGRAEFFRRQAKHAQRPIPTTKASPLDDSGWFAKGMEACRDLDSLTDGQFGKAGFASAMGIPQDEAERRLRVLTRAGFLTMSTERALSGDFIRFVWCVRDRSLPRNLGPESE
jgi:hypothetical protein